MKNLTGQVFNRLTVIKKISDYFYPSGQKTEIYLCKCICRNYVNVRAQNLLTNNTKSCGCLMKEKSAENGRKSSFKLQKYKGLPYDKIQKRLYHIWYNMNTRCNDKNNKRYGKRGIKVCKEWLNFENFYFWAIKNGFIFSNRGKYTLDRINNNGNYEPNNCRWISAKLQGRNRNNNLNIKFNNEIHCLSEWAEIVNISYDVLYKRLYKYNWTIEKTLTTPLRNSCFSTY